MDDDHWITYAILTAFLFLCATAALWVPTPEPPPFEPPAECASGICSWLL